MPSADTGTGTPETDDRAPETEAPEVDEGRTALLEALSGELGPALVDSHLIPGRDLWVRIDTEAWASTADYLRNRQRFRFFDWLSVVDWLPSPYGRSLDATVDNLLEGGGLVGDGGGDGGEDEPATESNQPDPAPSHGPSGAANYAGGTTRFQILARVYNLTTKLGVNLKADVGHGGGTEDLRIASWTPYYPGADWHEREAWEMFGITFVGHPGLRKLYLPGDFEGHPMRKDFPLLARLIKPWPGIVDVEPMPGVADEGPATANPEGES